MSDLNQQRAVPGTSRPSIRSQGWTGAVEGNARLTASTGLVLLVLLFIEGMTVLGVKTFFTVHAFVGLLLIPPILLKMTSTGYRFVRYYSGNSVYRETGPPHLIPRITAPFLVASTVGLFGTGVVLLVMGPGHGDALKNLHSNLFFVWFVVMAIHVLTYVGRTPRLAFADLRPGPPPGAHRSVAGVVTRESLLAGSILLGLVIAIVAIPWDAAWLFKFLHDH